MGGGGARGGANFQQAHDVVLTSMRRNDVASTSFRRHVPTRLLINQCQIITFLILKSDNIENSRTELKGIVLPKLKLYLLLFYLQLAYFCVFFLFHIEIEGLFGWIIREGGGAKGMLVLPLKLSNYGGAGSLSPPPSSYAYANRAVVLKSSCIRSMTRFPPNRATLGWLS